jgi:hypothetical protein
LEAGTADGVRVVGVRTLGGVSGSTGGQHTCGKMGSGKAHCLGAGFAEELGEGATDELQSERGSSLPSSWVRMI